MRVRPLRLAVLAVVLWTTGCGILPCCPETAEEAGLPAHVRMHPEEPAR